jgi:ATP-dependent DNA helicase RecQ
MSTVDDARELLAQFLGPGARFRPGQLEAIEALVDGRQRVLVVERTGWGKSVVYLIATCLLRAKGHGPTLVVSPLLALMRNQIEMGERIGVRSATINSENVDDWRAIEQSAQRGDVDLLLISPERLNNPRFRENVLGALAGSVGAFVIDEVHCISDWGHDFRPDYRRVGRVLGRLPRTVPVLGCTATANDRVVADIQEQLGAELLVIRGALARESLRLSVIDLPSQGERLAWLATTIPEMPGTGIVYCLTIQDAERVNQWLQSRGVDSVAYTGQTPPDERLSTERDLLENRVKVVVATSALGMGYDKPDLAFVVHFQSPGSPIAYYQQIGRAGRALETAEVVLLRGHEDRDIQDWFITTAFPSAEDADDVLTLLEAQDEPIGVGRIETGANLRRSRLEAMLKILEVEGAVGREGGKWYRTAARWEYDHERVRRVTEHRRREQEAMVEYATTDRCLMQVLLDSLDDPATVPCGRCGNCDPRDPNVPSRALAAEATEFLRNQPIVLAPRRQWPTGLEQRRGRIGPDELLGEGRALCVWGDGGWGPLVREGKYEDGRFDDDLVAAAAALVEAWGPAPPPGWVSCVPSDRHPELVPDFARRLAAALGLPFAPVIHRTQDTPSQKDMENSAQQAGNILGAFAIDASVSSDPVLLVDDVADSRWTLTIIGSELRRADVNAVHPLVLARATGA